MIQGHIVVAPDGIKGFDANQPVTREQAKHLRQKGYSFAARYVRRTERHEYDLTYEEADGLLEEGLGLMLVQHVPLPNWAPSAALGSSYGATAVAEAQGLGIPAGTMIWLDLEEVRAGIPSSSVIDYCNVWHQKVADALYNPGLYVGYHPGLSGDALYRKLRFAHYWGAYNLDGSEVPIIRGLQCRQMVAKHDDLIPPFTNETFDVDIAQADALGGRIQLLTRGWCE